MIKQLVDYKTRRLTEAVLRVDIPIRENKDWNWKLLLLSDLHFDHPRCNRKLLLKLLKEAIEINAGIIITGDVLDVMGGRDDPRWLRNEVRPEYLTKNGYFRKIIEDCAEFLKPFSSHIIMLSEGNHETKIIKKNDRELIPELVDEINQGSPYFIHAGEYAGFIDLAFNRSNGVTVDKKLYSFHHGGYTTESAKIARCQYLPDVDMFSSGHNHDLAIKSYARKRILPSGEIWDDVQWFVNVPSLKDDFGNGTSGFAVEQRHRPKPLGCVWWDFSFSRELKRMVVRPIPGA